MQKKPQHTKRLPKSLRLTQTTHREDFEKVALEKRDEEYIRTGYWEPLRTHDWDEY